MVERRDHESMNALCVARGGGPGPSPYGSESPPASGCPAAGNERALLHRARDQSPPIAAMPSPATAIRRRSALSLVNVPDTTSRLMPSWVWKGHCDHANPAESRNYAAADRRVRAAFRASPNKADWLWRQAVFGCHGALSLRIALRIVSSLRATAMIATILGFPAATSLSRKSFSTGLYRVAAIAPMNNTLRTLHRPPPMKLLPRHFPDWRVQGARPTRAAISRRSRVPNSGRSAIRVRAMIGPMPGTEASRSSFSRQAG